jgi:hypothetical protein
LKRVSRAEGIEPKDLDVGIYNAFRSKEYHWKHGVWVSLGLVFAKPSSLGFIALGRAFIAPPHYLHPPARGDPDPQLLLHRDLWFIAVGKPPHPGFLPVSRLHIEI